MKTLWLWLILAAAALGQVRFETLPPDCEVFWLSPQGARPADSVKVWPKGPLEFRISKPGYHPMEVSVPAGARRWPPEPGSFLRLQPMITQVRLSVEPSRAQVYLCEAPGMLQYLGTADQPLHVNLARVAGWHRRGTLELVLQHSGFQNTTVSVPIAPVDCLVWPPEGSVSLSPRWPVLSHLMLAASENPLLPLGALAIAIFVARWILAPGVEWLMRARWLERQMAGTDATDMVGARLGPYRLLKRIGEGGMASVYLGCPDDDRRDEARRAVKVLRGMPNFQAVLRQEVQALMRLRHPNIVHLNDWGEFEGLLYVVLEYVSGRTLRSYAGCAPDTIEPLLRQLFLAVGYAHQCGVVHGDLKPENVLVRSDGTVKVTDFGLSRLVSEGSQDLLGGTASYLAPECLRGVAATVFSDQYALGRILRELWPEKSAVAERMQAREASERFESVLEAWAQISPSTENGLGPRR